MTAPALTPGIDEILAGTQVYQMEDAILNNFPSAAPLLSLTNRMGTGETKENPVWHYMTDQPAPRKVAIAHDAYTGGTSTTFTVAAGSGKYFLPHQMFLGDNGIQYRTSSVAAGADKDGANASYDCITFEPSATTNSAYDSTTITTAHNMATGAYLYLMGTSMGEKSDVDEGWSEDPTIITQYIQNFFASVSLSDIAAKTKLYGGTRRENDHKKRMVEIAAAIETAYFLGKKATVSLATGDGTTWMMDGILNSISTNAINFASAQLTEEALLAKVPQMTEYAPVEDLAFFGSYTFCSAFARFGADALEVRPDDTRWGFAPKVWASPIGDFPLIRSRILDPWASGLSAFCLDVADIKKVLFTGGALAMHPNVQTSMQYQKIIDIYTSRHSIRVGREKFHSYLYGWTA